MSTTECVCAPDIARNAPRAAVRLFSFGALALWAGVGIGVYYDGHNGYSEEWTEANAKEFLAEIVKQGGEAIDIFRLCKDTVDDWPRADWWKTLIADFATGKL